VAAGLDTLFAAGLLVDGFEVLVDLALGAADLEGVGVVGRGVLTLAGVGIGALLGVVLIGADVMPSKRFLRRARKSAETSGTARAEPRSACLTNKYIKTRLKSKRIMSNS